MPVKPLTSEIGLADLEQYATGLLNGHRTRRPGAAQRIREFHPRFAGAADAAIMAAPFTLPDAQRAIAGEYGFRSWQRLRRHVLAPERRPLDAPLHDRIHDADFRRAVDLLDDGDADGLRAHIAAHPRLVRRRIAFEGLNYFQRATLLEFVAENPARRGRLPANIVTIARIILDAGSAARRDSMDSTLMLVASSRVARDCGAQIPLIDLLCDYGARPDAAMLAALVPGELDAIAALLRRGATDSLPVAAATNRVDDARRFLPEADAESRHRALTLSAHHGHEAIVGLMLDAGESPDRYNPIGCHAHSTPLHQAAYFGRAAAVRVLVERGARLDIRDIHHHGTPLLWAHFAGRDEIAAYLQNKGAPL